MLVKVALILQIFIYFAVAFHLSSQGEVVCLSQSSMAVSMQASSGTTESKKRVVICGATGYIGKYVVQESVRRGHDTIALVRPGSSTSGNNYLKGATIVYSDVADEQNLKDTVFKDKVDVVVSCLASRSGFKEDSYKIDYQATKNSLNAGIHGKADLFILLSAFCVRKPLLHFQKAKLKLEELLVDAQKTGKIPKYSIVRPTAFFKSVSGQFELLQQGWPFVMFGNGEIRKCNPIAESDLATYMLDCADKPERWNKV
ncbi:NAD-dependent epimerase/dehydratase family protein [archaeon]|nr:MAG: NAD-dependent epimerase/dehydratase family protein [archaeon]